MYYLLMKDQLRSLQRAPAANPVNRLMRRAGCWLLCLLGILPAGCATSKPKPVPEAEKVHERGWIGGEFKLAHRSSGWNWFFGAREEFDSTYPRGLAQSNRAGILITALSTNAPTRLAGLREGDLILTLNQQPITTMKAFRQTVDRTQPGTSLPIAAWREGQSLECNVTVGRETFKNVGVFAVGLFLPRPGDIGPFDLLPDPGFNLGVLGYDPTPEDRKELGSAKGIYHRACKGGKYQPSDQDWRVWLAIFSVWKSKTILSQEAVPARTSSATAGAAGQP
jgi:membrane-associated protease RseP (regulator of RpoE activity)